MQCNAMRLVTGEGDFYDGDDPSLAASRAEAAAASRAAAAERAAAAQIDAGDTALFGRAGGGSRLAFHSAEVSL